MTEETKLDNVDLQGDDNSDADAYAIISLAVIIAIAFAYYVTG